jgi:hypothetical protein
MAAPIPMQWSEVDQYGAYINFVWYKELFTLPYLEENGNFVAGLGSWLGRYREWGPHFSRL